ncbi:MAG: CHAP domain-containing protein [Bifidobacteriaceae bacterium]|nr:CHAP domain-containing protein [Bifidobacteriaceae bacterium]
MPSSQPTVAASPTAAASKTSTYEIFENQETWEAARDYCDAQGGHLATIESPEENDKLYAYMVAKGHASAYFGLYKATAGDWRWATSEPTGFIHWHEGEPNDERGQEAYGMFYWKYEDGTWNDGDFTLDGTVTGGRAFICEWDSGSENQAATSDEDLGNQAAVSKADLKKAKAYVRDFVNELPDGGVDTDGLWGMQCKDLANSYITSLGVKPPAGDAIVLKTWTLPNGWTRDGAPRPGDIFVKDFGSTGHTGLVTDVNADGTFETIDQNNGPNGEFNYTTGYKPTKHSNVDPKGYVFIHPEF